MGRTWDHAADAPNCMTSAQRKARDLRYRNAVANLAMNPHFTAFMELLREYREAAIREGLMADTVASERANLAAKGTVRAYTEILDIYEDTVATPQPDDAEQE
jgi:pantoate kinase